MRRTVAAHLDRARVSNTLQVQTVEWFRDLSVHHRRGRRRCRRNGHREHAAPSRCVPFVYVKRRLELAVVVDGRTVPMIAVLSMVRNSVDVKCARLDLQRKQGQHNEGRQAGSHIPSLYRVTRAGLKPCDTAAWRTQCTPRTQRT